MDSLGVQEFPDDVGRLESANSLQILCDGSIIISFTVTKAVRYNKRIQGKSFQHTRINGLHIS